MWRGQISSIRSLGQFQKQVVFACIRQTIPFQSNPLMFSTNAAKAQRIAKVLATSDLGYSRREAERVIEEGRVWINGEKIASPAISVTQSDVLQVDGKKVTFIGSQSTLMFVAHKLPGELVTRSDPAGRATIIDRLKLTRSLRKLVDQLVFVGRLDVNSEGLLLMTNSGELARKLEHPTTSIERRFVTWGLGFSDRVCLSCRVCLGIGIEFVCTV
mmetsp:Transcript_45211/g.57902  ORF Transcript_45211/g.57902 Transcript_45211/m.57902 type:complete len:215 (-) Transcript_45211:777-1421(-)